MDFFLPFMGILGSQALLSARNVFGAEQTTNKTTSTENASTYQDPWSDSSIGSSGSDKPAGATMTSEKEHCANSDTGAAKKQNEDPKTTHIGADISASRSDEIKVTTDRKHATVNSGDEMVLECITVKPDPSDFDIDLTSSPTDHELIASSPTRRKWAGPVKASLYDTPSSPAVYEPVAASPKKRKWVAPMAASLYDSEIIPSPTYEAVASPSKKRKWAAPLAASLFDVIHSPSPKKRLIRSPTATDMDFSFNIPLRTPMATENVDPQSDTQTPSKIRLRLTCPTPMAVFFNRASRASGWEPELTNEDMERLKAGEVVDKRPKPKTPPRRRIRQRTSDKTWDELSVVDKKGFLNTWTNQRNSTGTPRRKLQECKWVRYPKPEGYVPTPGEDPWVPRLVLTDPAGWHYSLDDLRFPTQRALPGI